MVGFRISVCAALLASLTVAGCGNGDPQAVAAVIEGEVVAAPVCSVEADSPDPACAPRPVPLAEITAVNLDTGSQIAAVADTHGRFRIDIEAGTLQLSGKPVEGLMGVPDPVEITAAPGDRHVVDLVYDTRLERQND